MSTIESPSPPDVDAEVVLGAPVRRGRWIEHCGRARSDCRRSSPSLLRTEPGPGSPVSPIPSGVTAPAHASVAFRDVVGGSGTAEATDALPEDRMDDIDLCVGPPDPALRCPRGERVRHRGSHPRRRARCDVPYCAGILRPVLLDMAGVVFLNAHDGRVPRYRGMHCCLWAIYNDDRSTAPSIE
jgi:hypothetical protein